MADDEDGEILQEIRSNVAVLLKTSMGMEKQLEKQNGFLREDHAELTQHAEQIEGLRKDRDEDRSVLKQVLERLRAVELTTAKLLVTGGTGGIIGIGGWLLIRYLVTGQIIP